jgi:hypothetical protein
MGPYGRWEKESEGLPLDSRFVRLLVTYVDDSYRNKDGEYIYFETEGFLYDNENGKWRISPPSHVADTYQEAEKKLKVMFWQYKTPHPKLKIETEEGASNA